MMNVNSHEKQFGVEIWGVWLCLLYYSWLYLRFASPFLLCHIASNGK